jgi:hypothetical protein
MTKSRRRTKLSRAQLSRNNSLHRAITRLALINGRSYMEILKSAIAGGLKSYTPARWANWQLYRLVGDLYLHLVPPVDAFGIDKAVAWDRYARDVATCSEALDLPFSLTVAMAALRNGYGWTVFWAANDDDLERRELFADRVDELDEELDELAFRASRLAAKQSPANVVQLKGKMS